MICQQLIQVRINGRRIPDFDIRVIQPDCLAERVFWAGYMFRTFGEWPGAGRMEAHKRDSVR